MSTRNLPSVPRHVTAQRFPRRLLLVVAAAGLLAAPLILRLLSADGPASGSDLAATGGASLLVLAVPAYLAGALSFLSPCCLPVLSAYVAVRLQTPREQVVRMSVAFFLGLATTMVALGATATLLSQVLFVHLRVLTLLGGLVVIGFGIMSLLGKGFTGLQLRNRPTAGVAGAYVYGATFALGWTACVGPILGALLTMLATQGLAVLEGALLAFVYALGLGTPLILCAGFLNRLPRDARIWRILRGRGWTLHLGRATLYLHTAGVASGLLLILVGLLLATGQLALFSRWAIQTSMTQWVLGLEDGMRQLLIGR